MHIWNIFKTNDAIFLSLFCISNICEFHNMSFQEPELIRTEPNPRLQRTRTELEKRIKKKFGKNPNRTELEPISS